MNCNVDQEIVEAWATYKAALAIFSDLDSQNRAAREKVRLVAIGTVIVMGETKAKSIAGVAAKLQMVAACLLHHPLEGEVLDLFLSAGEDARRLAGIDDDIDRLAREARPLIEAKLPPALRSVIASRPALQLLDGGRHER